MELVITQNYSDYIYQLSSKNGTPYLLVKVQTPTKYDNRP